MSVIYFNETTHPGFMLDSPHPFEYPRFDDKKDVIPTMRHFLAYVGASVESHPKILECKTADDLRAFPFEEDLCTLLNHLKIGLRRQFSQHDDLYEQLMATGEAKLVYHSTKDMLMGQTKKGARGANFLGSTLSKLREEFRAYEERRAIDPNHDMILQIVAGTLAGHRPLMYMPCHPTVIRSVFVAEKFPENIAETISGAFLETCEPLLEQHAVVYNKKKGVIIILCFSPLDSVERRAKYIRSAMDYKRSTFSSLKIEDKVKLTEPERNIAEKLKPGIDPVVIDC